MGNIVFSFIMMSVSIVLIVESIQEIATRATSSDPSDKNTFHVPAVLAVSIAFFVKFCLFCYCWPLRHYPQVPSTTFIPSNGVDFGRSRFCGKTIGMICLSMGLGS